MHRIAFTVVVVAAIAADACSGRSEGPISPSQTNAPTVNVRSAAGPLDAVPIDAANEPTLEAVDTRAAVNLTGVWKGRAKVNRPNVQFDTAFTLKHRGKTVSGKLTEPVIKGFTATLTLTEQSVKGTTRTYNASFKETENGGKCTPVTQTGTLVIDTAKNTLTGTTSGKNTDCINEIVTFTLKR